MTLANLPVVHGKGLQGTALGCTQPGFRMACKVALMPGP
jgi:hypothetical protein